MSPSPRSAARVAALAWLAVAPAVPAAGGRVADGVLRGTVTDPSGAVVPGATVRAEGRAGRRARTDARGEWRIASLPAGVYRVSVSRSGFSRSTHEGIVVSAGRSVTLDSPLTLTPLRESVEVRDGPEGRPAGGATVLEGALLDALPDDPDEMVAALAAMAGAIPGSAPPVRVDGFDGGRVPPKSAIRQIRLNASPYSAEYDYPGVGRVEIFTKPGGDRFHGHAQARVGGRPLDARPPFASGERHDDRRLAGSGSVSGPIAPGRASFFLDAERSVADEARLMNAVVLGPGLVPVPRNESLAAPQTRATLSPRIDAQLGRHTITARYSYAETAEDRAGVGGFSLPSQAFASTSRQHLLQLGDAFSTGRVSSEVRAQWTRQSYGQEPASLAPGLVVQDAFAAGGAAVGRSSRTHDRLELHGAVSGSAGAHALRAGLRLRHGAIRDESRLGWNGAVTFAGGLAPALDAGGRPLLDDLGRAVLVPVTSLERYRRTVALAAAGLSPAEVRALGGGASQLQLAGGTPVATLGQRDAAAFVQDDWRLGDELTVGLGLRAEAQPDLGGGVDLAPRASFAWTPGRRGTTAPKTVVRGGVGLFYERVADALFLDVRRLDPASPRRFVVTTDPEALDRVRLDASGGVVSLPGLDGLAGVEQGVVTRRFDDGIEAPATLAGSLSVDRTVSAGLALSAQWTHTTTWRALRSRVVSSSGGGAPVVYQYESTGRARQDQLMLGVSRVGRRLSLSARYFLSFAYGDTDGPASFPASSADPGADWSRASGDVRHRLVLTGTVVLPAELRLSPFVMASSGSPYDVTVGRDLDGDTIFDDRPAYTTDASRPGVVPTPFGLLDAAPAPGASIVPRNLGQGPGLLSVNLRLSRGFRLRGGTAGRRSGPELTVAVYAQNVFDRLNSGAPVGNLASPSFGRSLVTAGAPGALAAGRRTVELQVGTSF